MQERNGGFGADWPTRGPWRSLCGTWITLALDVRTRMACRSVGLRRCPLTKCGLDDNPRPRRSTHGHGRAQHFLRIFCRKIWPNGAVKERKPKAIRLLHRFERVLDRTCSDHETCQAATNSRVFLAICDTGTFQVKLLLLVQWSGAKSASGPLFLRCYYSIRRINFAPVQCSSHSSYPSMLFMKGGGDT